MKLSILTHLNHQNQVSLLKNVSDEEQNLVFNIHDNSHVLSILLKSLSKERQKETLQLVYNRDREKYHKLKASFKSKISIIDGVIITKTQDIATVIEADIERLLKQFKDQHCLKSEMDTASTRLEQKYDLEDLEKLITSLVHQFKLAKVGLKNASDFSVHLKFYQLFFPFLRLFPRLEKDCAILIDQLIMSLSKIADTNWVFKVLNQLPLKIIQVIMKRLNNYGGIKQFEKRNIYCKLLKRIQDGLETTSAENVKQAITML